jgi:hypothetical protein
VTTQSEQEGAIVMRTQTTYIDEIQDPVTGEFIVLEAATQEELDDLVARHFDFPFAEDQA